MKGRMDNELGSIVIDTDVIATYAGSVAVECFGIIGMAAVNMKDVLKHTLLKENFSEYRRKRNSKNGEKWKNESII